jgi:hypothetical protein
MPRLARLGYAKTLKNYTNLARNFRHYPSPSHKPAIISPADYDYTVAVSAFGQNATNMIVILRPDWIG